MASFQQFLVNGYNDASMRFQFASASWHNIKTNVLLGKNLYASHFSNVKQGIAVNGVCIRRLNLFRIREETIEASA